MIEGYNTIHEKAKQWEISERALQTMCAEGKIKGATKFGRSWAIPNSAERPADGRITSGKYRNWRKPRTVATK